MAVFKFGNVPLVKKLEIDKTVDNHMKKRLIYSDNGYSQLNNFNRYNLFESAHTLTGTKSYIFFTRPDCYILDGPNMTDNCKRIGFIYESMKHPKRMSDLVIRQLQRTGMHHPNDFFPLLSNFATGYSPVDDELESLELGDTYHGHKSIYAKHNIKTRTSGTANITFRDNGSLHVYTALKAYNEYCENVSLGLVSPRQSDVFDMLLDYPLSMFYLVTELDGETLLYWEMVTGMFPTNVPNSVFDMKENSATDSRDFGYNIPFRYFSRSKALDPMVLYKFNKISNNGSIQPNSSKILSSHKWNGFDWYDDTIAGAPVVVRNNVVGEKTNEFLLKWVRTGGK